MINDGRPAADNYSWTTRVNNDISCVRLRYCKEYYNEVGGKNRLSHGGRLRNTCLDNFSESAAGFVVHLTHYLF